MLLSRVGLFVYWINDNIQILCALKLINGDAEYWNRMGMLSWWISLVLTLIQSVRTYMQQDAQLKYYVDFVGKNPEKKEAFKDQFKAAKAARTDALLNIVKTVGDLFTATKGSGKLNVYNRSG